MREFAAELRERARGGESFEDLARSYSSDAASAERGGILPAASRGEWVPAFAGAAFSLSPGEISEPVLTQSGYHLILLHKFVREDGVEKAEASHIQLNITTGTETADSILAVAEALREDAGKSGLAVAAASAGLTVLKTGIFAKGTLSPLGNYVQGVASFTFSPMERKAKISEALQNEEGIYVLERDARFAKGRDFDRARDAVARDLVRVRSLEAARAEAERVRPEILAATSLPERIGAAVLETTGPITAESFTPGFGFGNAGLFKVMHQTPGEWGSVTVTPEAAVIAKVTEVSPLPAADKAQRIQVARYEGDMFQTSNLYQQWAQDLPKSVRVKNRLDEVYRN
jgi:peptidyl-prolyl cis-trans isomerase D